MYLSECIKKQTHDEQLVPTTNKSTKNYGTFLYSEKKFKMGSNVNILKGSGNKMATNFFIVISERA